MLKNKLNYINLITILLTSIILINYFILFFVFEETIIFINVLMYILIITFFVLFSGFNFLYLRILFLLLIIITLGDASEDWDAWAIWLFKSKRIFYDQSIYSILDGYAPFSNNDQPLLAPSFSASIAVFFDKWNNIFPKVGFLLISFPPLIYSLNVFRDNFNFLFICLTIYIINTFFVNGLVDGLVSLYMVFSAYLAFKIFVLNNYEKYEKFIFLNFLCILSLLKNEGLAIIVIIFTSILIVNFINKKKNRYNSYSICLLILFLLPIFSWKYLVILSGIGNFHFSENILSNFWNRILHLETYLIIFRYIFSSYSLMFFALLFFITSYFNKDKIISLYVFLISFSYASVVILIFLISKMDFEWGVASSFDRVIAMPLTYLIVFFLVHKFQSLNKN